MDLESGKAALTFSVHITDVQVCPVPFCLFAVSLCLSVSAIIIPYRSATETRAPRASQDRAVDAGSDSSPAEVKTFPRLEKISCGAPPSRPPDPQEPKDAPRFGAPERRHPAALQPRQVHPSGSTGR